MPPKNSKNLDIVIIGSGNVAFHLSRELKRNGHRIVQILGRTKENAAGLAKILQCEYVLNASEINRDAQLYMLCIPDSSITLLSGELPKLKGTVVHTSGSTALNVLSKVSDSYGVFYPFQTFSKIRELNFSGTPFCIESSSQEVQNLLFDVAQSIGGKPLNMDSETRRWLHIAGVFGCNFVNHMLAISYLIVQEKGIPFETLKPLVMETIAKAFDVNPVETQTGPAIRGDSDLIKNHVALLTSLDEDIRDIYMAMSTSILNFKQDR
ncbi:MAG: Rossmann-like and DUF2520 domain-containing protein [Tenuifilaceae bacterium]|jgi:predicted short-subunit dehydrogenase-like oxidoreductase (DUF2520 family)|nr:DUF2520 domain-containing protein [Bacteroidales bacterium]MDI9515827.1 DUF2520 domain-containing protein [Bacteroidota bacterium]NLH57735.1 DUF2520 domain-containing protein [Rikenellaceae bacterium]OQC63420.1 MAG: Rossmann-like domain protein [Bacteroidetes bacterium ADurb.Bin008]HNV82478.1 DUF2520 domain-containing protein [Tenuifilaceae bacterium]